MAVLQRQHSSHTDLPPLQLSVFLRRMHLGVWMVTVAQVPDNPPLDGIRLGVHRGVQSFQIVECSHL